MSEPDVTAPSTKRCIKCGVEHPADRDHFYGYQTRSHGRDHRLIVGLRNVCIACTSKRRSEVYAAISRGEAPPVPPVPDGFELTGISTEVSAEGETQSQWLRAREGSEVDAPIAPTLPPSHYLKGVSTLVDGSGNVRAQWQKTAVKNADRLDALALAIADISRPFKGDATPAIAPSYVDDDLLCIYPMGDPHLGMYAWAAETGADFDVDIAERNLVAATDHLVGLAPPARRALIIDLGDFFHMDSTANATSRSHNRLDVDTRWPKVLSIGIRTMRRIIDRALEKHDEVTVICEIGNHDDHSAIMLALCLANYYEREPRVRIDTSPSKFHWYRFGRCLVATTHTDTVKPNELAEIMAADRPEDWGETEFRYWYTGHVHHDRVIEKRGVLIESFRTLAPRDAWADAAGYRAGQDMKLDILHREHGRINRHVVGVSQITR